MRSVTDSFDGRREIAYANFSSPCRVKRSRMEMSMNKEQLMKEKSNLINSEKSFIRNNYKKMEVVAEKITFLSSKKEED